LKKKELKLANFQLESIGSF